MGGVINTRKLEKDGLWKIQCESKRFYLLRNDNLGQLAFHIIGYL